MWRVVMVAACLCVLCESQSDLFQPQDKRGSRRYCGPTLVSTLHIICNGTYYTNIRPLSRAQKKAWPDSDDDVWMELQLPENVERYPFRSRASAVAFPRRVFKRQSWGVADECCVRKGCDYNELSSYCAP
ncbi:LIRP-like [Periplaneta americana]